MKISKTPNEVREDFLRTIKAGLIQIGVPDPNVSQNSDYYVLGTAVADVVSQLFANIEIYADEQMPDTATKTDLDRLLSIYGLQRRPAGVAYGKITLVSDQPTFVVTGNELVSALGNVYQVVIGGTYSNGSIIDVVSKDNGDKVNLAAGSILTWVAQPAGAQSTVVVTNAITGGVDVEDDETARARLLGRFANPPGAGNWQQVCEIAEQSDSVVQKAFVHAAANGPGTLHVTVVGYPSSVSKSREIDANKLNSSIIPAIKGSLPEYVETLVTTVNDVNADVAFKVTLPLATSSFGANGGGWLDPTPFPSVNDSTVLYCDVTVVTDSTHITVKSAAPPSPNLSRIAWIDRSTWTVKTARVLSYTGTGPYALTLDTPLVGVAVGDYISPGAVNLQKYLDAVLGSVTNPQGFFLLGPYEKTLLVQRAARQPRTSSGFPYSIDGSILRALINSGEEVATAEYSYRSSTTPSLPASINDAPNILIPRHLGFYAPYPLTA